MLQRYNSPERVEGDDPDVNQLWVELDTWLASPEVMEALRHALEEAARTINERHKAVTSEPEVAKRSTIP